MGRRDVGQRGARSEEMGGGWRKKAADDSSDATTIQKVKMRREEGCITCKGCRWCSKPSTWHVFSCRMISWKKEGGGGKKGSAGQGKVKVRSGGKGKGNKGILSNLYRAVD